MEPQWSFTNKSAQSITPIQSLYSILGTVSTSRSNANLGGSTDQGITRYVQLFGKWNHTIHIKGDHPRKQKSHDPNLATRTCNICRKDVHMRSTCTRRSHVVQSKRWWLKPKLASCCTPQVRLNQKDTRYYHGPGVFTM